MKEFELEPGEHVVRQMRKHWFVFLAELLPYAILAVLPLAIPAFMRVAGPLAQYADAIVWSDPVVRVVLGAWWLMIWVAAFNTFTRYFLNLWVLTNERIVDIKQRGFFNREVSSLLLNRVQDVTIDTEGLMPSLLDFGDIHVQSAGASERFVMRGIPLPMQMRDLILKYVSVHPSSAGI